MKIKLSQVIDAIQMASNFDIWYFDKDTGETLRFPDYDDYDHSRYALEYGSERYVEFPGKYDLDQYDIMAGFVSSLSPGDARDELYACIHGTDAHDCFEKLLYKLDLDREWHSFRDQTYKGIAINWCKENDIGYEE